MQVRTLLLEEVNTHSGTVGFAPEKYNEPQFFLLTLLLLKITSRCNSGRGLVGAVREGRGGRF